MNKQNIPVAIVFVVVLVSTALASYFLFDSPAANSTTSQSTAGTTAQTGGTANQNQSSQTTDADNRSAMEQIFGADDSAQTSPNRALSLIVVTVRLALATLLTAMLAFRPRKSGSFVKRNLFVAQTQILLAVVGSALMMIVGDSAARAFGIFAAVSLVRFRTNISDPKEITVLLVSLSVGLATGVGRWDLAAVLSLFVLILLWALEFRESKMVFRSMELKVTTRNIIQTHEAIRDILKKYQFNSELRTLNREDEDEPLGEIVFSVEMSPLVSTDVLSDEILTADHDNIDSIEWSRQKNAASVYQ